MSTLLTIGGTRFIGRHTVEAFLDAGYDVTTFTRGESGDPFADRERVSSVHGDRNERADLERARDAVDPDVVVDFVGLFPAQVETACSVFGDCDAYVFVSSGSAYGRGDVPMREDETPLCECTPEQAEDESMASYGPRKAECDRAVFAAAADGANAIAVRPMLVYGPHDYTERTDYWLSRMVAHDRVVVPGDGDALLHRAYVEDVARGLLVAAERGTPGEAYNVADRVGQSLEAWLERAADALGTDVEFVHASERELAETDADLALTDFPLYTPQPALAATGKLAALGWGSTDLDTAYERTVADHRESDRDGSDVGPSREAEERVIETLTA